MEFTKKSLFYLLGAWVRKVFTSLVLLFLKHHQGVNRAVVENFGDSEIQKTKQRNEQRSGEAAANKTE